VRILFAEYDRSPRREFIFPDYNDEFVKVKKSYRGFSNISYIEHEIRLHKGTLNHTQNKFYFKDSSVYSAYKALYSPDGKYIIMDADSKSRNIRKILRYDPKAKTFEEIYSESTDGWFERHSGKIIFISSTEFLFESESNGFNNIYKLNLSGGIPVNLTNGYFTVTDFTADTSAGKIYFTANAGNPLVYSVYETDFISSYLRQLTQTEGSRSDIIADDSGYLFYKYSYITQPDELYMLDLNSLNETRITYTVSPAFSSVRWTVPETITFYNKEDGEKIYGYLYKPQNFNHKQKYPLICFAHGAGYLQNVTTSFSPYQDNFMFNSFLNQNGFLVLDVDFRGSAGYGKNFRTKTYKNLGYWEVSDYISGIMYLDSLGIVDRNNVGIYGGSYGGFITLMAAFRKPDIFSCGVSLRAVTDWKNYYYSNPRYTIARLGDYDSSNIHYYRISSPVTYASQLEIPLLITHGMLDDNVFFQDMVQLTQKLIDERKDFEIMFHPRESHRYSNQSSWFDLYKRIWKFFEEHLK
jgi:dipeptidyl aminopeptidase/acylaminoacyl peptidase